MTGTPQWVVRVQMIRTIPPQTGKPYSGLLKGRLYWADGPANGVGPLVAMAKDGTHVKLDFGDFVFINAPDSVLDEWTMSFRS